MKESSAGAQQMMGWARKPWWVRDKQARQKQDLFDVGEEQAEEVER